MASCYTTCPDYPNDLSHLPNTLSSPMLAGGTSGSGASAPAPPQAATSGDQPGFDSSKPSTSLQFRLLDGSKLTGKFNLDATVGEVYR